MRVAWRLCAVGAMLACAVSPAAAQAVKSDQQTLMDLERQWDAAFRNGNVKFIEGILDADFVVTYDNGTRGGKAEELALAASFNQQIDDSALEDFTVRLYGNTAVVQFTLHLLGPIQGKPVELVYRYIDVWVLREASWRCVASQSTRVTPARDTPAN